jgi:hypothetical protein
MENQIANKAAQNENEKGKRPMEDIQQVNKRE